MAGRRKPFNINGLEHRLGFFVVFSKRAIF